MKITSKWEPSEQEIHEQNLRVQDSDRKIRRLIDREWLYANLTIYSKKSPETISSMLGQTPDDVDNIGDSHEAGRFVIEYTSTIWTLSTEGNVREKHPETHINWLLDQIEANRQNLWSLQNSGARTSITVHYFMHCWVQATDLSVETLLRLARLRLKLQIMVHAESLQQEDEDDADDEEFENADD